MRTLELEGDKLLVEVANLVVFEDQIAFEEGAGGGVFRLADRVQFGCLFGR